MTVTRRINKKNIITISVLFKNQNTGWYSGSIKQICRKSDNCIQQIKPLNYFFSDFTFTCTTEQNSMWKHDSHSSVVVIKTIKHVKNKCIITLRTWRNSPIKTSIRIKRGGHLFFFLIVIVF